MQCTVVNLESGMPAVEAARVRLDQALRTAKARRVTALKIIHGYGSTGRGGAIKQDVQRFLLEKKRNGTIREFVAGERFSPFDASARSILSQCSELSRDRDYSRCNQGITIVLL